MPLSAAFCFFSPFHYKKKLLYQSFFSSSLFFLFSPSSHFGELHSAPIFVMLLITLLNITKSQATYTANRNRP